MAGKKIGGDLVKGHMASLVLAVLARSPRHGYDIMKTLSERSEGVFDLGQGTIYPLLYSLEEERLVKSRESVVNGRTRRVYSLTARGRKRLAEKRATWRVFETAMNRILQPARFEEIGYVTV